MIEDKDISVVVQGAINEQETPKCLNSIRKYLPDAEIILSTWEGSDVSGLDYDILILNKEPKVFIQHKGTYKTYYNNLNRQLLSTQNGLKKVNRKYAMKLRSDLILSSADFLKYFNMFQKRTDRYNLFKRKVLTSTLISRYEYKVNGIFVKIPFHVSDWWFFGLTEDLNKYFLETPLVDDPYFTEYYKMPENKNKVSPYGNISFRFAPEQYFGYTPFANNFYGIYMEDASDVSDELFKKSRLCLINNFIMLENKQSGIHMNKYSYSKNEELIGDSYFSLYTYSRYELEYMDLCDKNYKPTTNVLIYKDKDLLYSYGRFKKHYNEIFFIKNSILKKLECIFLSLPYSFIKYVLFLINSKLKKHN